MTILIAILVVAAVLALALMRARRVLGAVGQQPDGLHVPRMPLPPSTGLPRGNVSHPRLIGRRRHAAHPGPPARPALAGLAIAGTGLLLLLAPLGRDAKHHATPATPTPMFGTRLAGVGMPGALPGNRAVKPLEIAIVIDDTYTGKARARELRALGGWLQSNHNPRTRITIIDRARRRASRRLAAADLGHVRLVRRAPRLTRMLRRALKRYRNRLLVTIGDLSNPTLTNTATLRVHPRRGASTANDVQLVQGDHRVVHVDPRRRGALAATVARAVITISGMRERQ